MLLVPSVSLGPFLVLSRLLACKVIAGQYSRKAFGKAFGKGTERYIRNFLCAILFWILRLSSGSDTSAQSSDLGDLDLDFDDPVEECFLELDFGSDFEVWGAMASGEGKPASVDVRLRREDRGTCRLDV